MNSTSPDLPAPSTHAQGVALFRAAKYEEARAAFEAASAQARAAQDKRAAAEAANDLGVTLQKLRQRQAARAQLESVTHAANFPSAASGARFWSKAGNLTALSFYTPRT